MPKKIWYAPNQFESYGEEEIKAVEACLRDGWLAGFGKRTVAFEERVADLFGKKHGLFVNSGSSAILLGLCALDLPKGSEVVTPACGFATTIAPIIQLGLRPVFCDVNPTSYVPTLEHIRAVVTPSTKCILLPNLIGNVPDWCAIREAFPGIPLFEDSADTITHTPSSDISTTSFYASHVITAGGIGGMVMFNDAALLKRALMFRDWGRIGDNVEEPGERFNHSVDGIPYDWKFLYGVAGYHLKACEMNAAFGLVQLDKLDGFLATRRSLIQRYITNLKDCSYFTLPDDSKEPNWLAIPLQCPDRLELVNFMEANNVQTRVTFAGNITRHPAFREYLHDFENADRIMKDGFLLGAHHGMTLDDVDTVCDLLKVFASTFTIPESMGWGNVALCLSDLVFRHPNPRVHKGILDFDRGVTFSKFTVTDTHMDGPVFNPRIVIHPGFYKDVHSNLRDIIQPNAELQALIERYDHGLSHGIHIRRGACSDDSSDMGCHGIDENGTIKPAFFAKDSALQKFIHIVENTDVSFFLASDSQSIKDMFKERFPTRIVTLDTVPALTYDCKVLKNHVSKEQRYGAYLDWFLLAKCKDLYITAGNQDLTDLSTFGYSAGAYGRSTLHFVFN
jgi:CDP-6-deoxy-D-xylo-4-hexulose-3-dehydrase